MTGSLVPLAQAGDTARFGGKAAGLADAIARGFLVPGGVALSADLAEGLGRGEAGARNTCANAIASFEGARLAIRSSGVDEDGGGASFAGQHATRLGIATLDSAIEAIREVWSSAHEPGALAYRSRLGLSPQVRTGVILQRMVDADCAGVMFTRSPTSGANERVIEAAWGLGEGVVAGRVVPDRYRVAPGGSVIAFDAGDKDVAITISTADGTTERSVAADLRIASCLDAAKLLALETLAAACDAAYGEPSDVEWAFKGERLYLLQRRRVTR